jgi:precorrin-6Y C5,15-methyltransferase (decarboxylating)
VGAGSGSISIEAIKLAPLMRVISFEKDPTAYENLKGNMKSHNVVFETHLSDFYTYKRTLPKADRILIGGGKLDQLDRLLNVANPNATIVGTFASLDRAQKLAKILGNLVQININTGKTFTDGTMHLVANNPVFIVWGQFNSI